MAEIKYEIVQEICVLSESARGWTKELNLVSWNDREPKFDIREWAPEHSRMGQGCYPEQGRNADDPGYNGKLRRKCR